MLYKSNWKSGKDEDGTFQVLPDYSFSKSTLDFELNILRLKN